LLNGIAVTVRMAATVLLNKMAAAFVGPAGFAMIGQFQNALTLVTSLGAGALSTGVTKYTAEYGDDPAQQRALWKTAGTLTLLVSITTSVLLAVLRRQISVALFGTADLSDIVAWVAGSLTLISLNALLLAILNGKKETWLFVQANIAGSVVLMVMSAILISAWGLRGALIALSANQAVLLVFTLLVCRRALWFRVRDLAGAIDRAVALNLGKFVLMAATSAVVLPIGQMAIRAHIVSNFDLAHAGYWDAVNRLSGSCLTLATTTLALYYLPRISEIQKFAEMRSEILHGLRVIVPIAAVAALVLFAAREWVVKMLFTSAFLPLTELLPWQLAGDVVKIASWLLAYVLIGKAQAMPYVVTEVAFTATLYLLTVLGTHQFGFDGAAIAYLLNYLLYLATMYVLVLGPGRRTLFPPAPATK